SAALTAWRLGAGDTYRAAAQELVSAHIGRGIEQPFAHGTLLLVAAGLVDPPRQVVVVTSSRGGALGQAAWLVDADVTAVVTPAQAQEFADAGFELFAGKSAGVELAYDCRAFVCKLPTADPSALAVQR
ncbi:MAG TPA: thioredoxin domain-containing protein, partial [Microbacterium sp.]|nr:thioredoxin domain-containing protein [Microbacterium sp.]